MPTHPSKYQDVPPIDLLSWLFAQDNRNDEQNIFIDAYDDTQRLNTTQAISLIRKLVSGLHAIGLGTGDAVCFHAFNNYLYSTIYLGIVGSGGCFVGSNPGHTTSELIHHFETTKSKYFIVEADLFDKVLPALLGYNVLASRVFIFDAPDTTGSEVGFKSWKSLLDHGEKDWIRFDDEVTAKTTVAALMCTSGTTGIPKAAAMSHYAQVACAISVQSLAKRPYQVRRLISIPQFHAFAAPLVHIAPFKFKQTTYIMRRFDLSMFVKHVHHYEITETAIVPPMMASLVNGCSSPQFLETLRWIWCAGSRLPMRLSDSMYNLLHREAVISQNWGMTELGWVSTFDWPEKDETGSVGRLLPNMEARLIDKHGSELTKEGALGEIQIRGPSMMKEYFNDPGATLEAIDSGWLKTGDMGSIKNGKVYIVDRIKEMIKVRGWQVSPSELELVILLNPEIVDAAVVPVQIRGDYMDIECPRAYVVLRPNTSSQISECDVKEFVRVRVAKYKALDGGVEFVESIPRSASGKILRKVLVARVHSR